MGYTYWTEEEEKKLRSLYLKKLPIHQISIELDRPLHSVKAKLAKLSINTRKVEKAETLPGEIWKAVDFFPNYFVSNMGRVKNLKGNLLAFHLNHNGYQRVSLRRGGPSEMNLVHRLVANAFVAKKESDEELFVNHKNGNKLRNEAENLEWTTASENLQHAVDTGLKQKGSECDHAKLDEKIVKKICRMISKGYSINTIRAELDIEKLVTEETVRNIRRRKTWKHVSKDFIW